MTVQCPSEMHLTAAEQRSLGDAQRKMRLPRHLTLKDDTTNVPNHHLLDVVQAVPFKALQAHLEAISSDCELKAAGDHESDDPPGPPPSLAALVRPTSHVMQCG